MVQGLDLAELKARLKLTSETIKYYVLMDVEGEILFYHRERDAKLIECYKSTILDLAKMILVDSK